MAIINGNNLNNVIFGTGVADTINGNEGDDLVNGAGGNDLVTGGIGNDVLLGESGNDQLTGNAGHDTILGGSGNDTIEGDDGAATGNDILDGGEGDDTINGGNGDDIIYSSAGTDTVQGGEGNDVYFLFKDDSFGGFGSTFIADSGGIDTLNFSLLTSGAEASLIAGTNFVFNSGDRTVSIGSTGGGGALAEIENAIGSDFDDKILGNALANRIEGGAGNDRLFGLAGSDTLIADAGADRLYGGAVTRLQQNSTLTSSGAAFQTLTVEADVGDDFSAPGYNEILTQGTSTRLHVTFDLFALVDATSSATNFVLRAGIRDPNTFEFVPLNIVDEGMGNDVPAASLTGGFTAIQGLGSQTQSFDFNIHVVGLDPNQGDDIVVELAAVNTRGSGGSSLRTDTVSFGREDLGATVSGDDTLDGGPFGPGVSTLIGGDGNDTYILHDYRDLVQENADEGTDLVQIEFDYTLPFAVENLTLLDGGEAATGNGNDLDNVITGNSGNNFLNGGGGNDTIIGGLGDDTIDGGFGDDSMTGGDGNDTYYLNASDTITEGSGASSGIDTVILRGIAYTLAANVENGELDATSGLALTGNVLNNILTGNGFNNTLNGGAGNDIMRGGFGNDTYFVGQSGDVVEENLLGGTDTVNSALVATTLGNNLENLTLLTGAVTGMGNALDNVIFGNSAANTLNGGIGNDRIDGSLGGDTMDGGTGNDFYFVDNLADTIIDASGIDTVQTAIQLAGPLFAPIENLILTGALALNGLGNVLHNRITGNNFVNTLTGDTGNDILEGGAGNDTLNGGAGNDTLIGGSGIDVMQGGSDNDVYIIDSLADVVTELAGGGTADRIESVLTISALAAEVENLTLLGTAAGATGNALANRIVGNAGNNIIDGAGGFDTMIGGLGNDVYKVDTIGEVVSELLDQGVDRVESSVSFVLGQHVENLTLLGSSNLNGAGNALVNTITGNSGANTLDGGLGADTLIGGAGNDVYLVDLESDTVTETLTGGTDLVISTAVQFTLGAFVENLTLSGTAISGTGNALVNRVVGTNLDNNLNGGIGADLMFGLGGNDIYIVDNVGDIVTDTAGVADEIIASVTRTLEASIEHLTLDGASAINGTGNGSANRIFGNNAVNTLSGLGGDDLLDGGLGADTMTGGTGLDVFQFGVLENVADTITDFSVADDQIQIDSFSFGGGLVAGDAVQINFNTLDAIGTGGQFFYNDTTAELHYDQNGTDADGLFLIAIVLGGQSTIDVGDFVII